MQFLSRGEMLARTSSSFEIECIVIERNIVVFRGDGELAIKQYLFTERVQVNISSDSRIPLFHALQEVCTILYRQNERVAFR